MKKYTSILSVILFFFIHSNSWAQPAESFVKVNVAPEKTDWVYKPNEKVKFAVSITKNDIELPNVAVRYEVGPEMMSPVKTENVVLKNGTTVIDGGTLKEAGFLRCRVVASYEGKEYSGLATAAFSPDAIQSTTNEPEDFWTFWQKAKAEASKIPLDARVRLLPDRCTEKVNVYEVNIQNYKPGTRLFGIVCVPKAPGKYPALLHVPGAGVRGYYGDVNTAEKGVITLQIGIHGVPVTLDAS
ncbi:MAG TPA: acetylxylan esterase, partial [Porphyromonadaceae bacterium]|nr:acetylxylan esterase [Porphyromonadaceae bacterium]